jgi:hypothetical protein
MTALAKVWRENQGFVTALRFPIICHVCGFETDFQHDHQDGFGLDDEINPQLPRKKAEPKSQDETKRIRAQAWATRRAKYGVQGHGGYHHDGR